MLLIKKLPENPYPDLYLDREYYAVQSYIASIKAQEIDVDKLNLLAREWVESMITEDGVMIWDNKFSEYINENTKG